MKTIYTKMSLIAGVLILMSVSCTKKIDLYPITSDVETNFYKDQKDCFQGLTAAYNVLLWDAPQNQNIPFQLISEVLGDNCFTGGANATDIPGTLRIDRGQSPRRRPCTKGILVQILHWHLPL